MNVWFQKQVRMSAKRHGCHLVTDEILSQIQPQLKDFKVGMANFFLQHSSASLTLNENYDPDVRVDMEMMLNRIAPEVYYSFLCAYTNNIECSIYSYYGR